MVHPDVRLENYALAKAKFEAYRATAQATVDVTSAFHVSGRTTSG